MLIGGREGERDQEQKCDKASPIRVTSGHTHNHNRRSDSLLLLLLQCFYNERLPSCWPTSARAGERRETGDRLMPLGLFSPPKIKKSELDRHDIKHHGLTDFQSKCFSGWQRKCLKSAIWWFLKYAEAVKKKQNLSFRWKHVKERGEDTWSYPQTNWNQF